MLQTVRFGFDETRHSSLGFRGQDFQPAPFLCAAFAPSLPRAVREKPGRDLFPAAARGGRELIEKPNWN
jgi:hypothetical protein